jgi:hypothetical protein
MGSSASGKEVLVRAESKKYRFSAFLKFSADLFENAE